VIRYLGAAAVLFVIVTLAGPTGGLASTDNTFCEFEPGATCAAVLMEEITTNPCNGEVVNLSGTIHVAVYVDENQFRIHTNWQDIVGVGVTSGAIYQANEAFRQYTVQRPSGAFTFVLQDERELVTKGGLANWIQHEYMEITVDDDEVTIRPRSQAECRG
jgi:hypothetical protein